MKEMNNIEKQALIAVYIALTSYREGAKRDKVISVACSNFEATLGHRPNTETLVNAAFDLLLTEKIVVIIPYSEMTADQKLGEDRYSGVFYKLQRDLTEAEMQELTT